MIIKLEYKPLNCELKYPFGISRSIKYSVSNIAVKLSYDYNGKTYNGFGEAAPSLFYGETPESVSLFYEKVKSLNIMDTEPYCIQEINYELAKIGGNFAAKAGIDIALYDLIGKIHNIPVYKLLGFNNKPPKTSYTIDISDLEMILKKTAEAVMANYEIFKVKLGTKIDEEIIFSIRQAAPDAIIRVDANCAWDLKTAIRMAKYLEKHNIEFIEQPLAKNNINDLKILRESTTLPIIVDESCMNYYDVPKLSGLVDGINIKLSKCGGITNALKTLNVAKACNMNVMVGCFLESSLAISAAALVASQADYADLDGSLLIKEDPYNLITFDIDQATISDHAGITGRDLF